MAYFRGTSGSDDITGTDRADVIDLLDGRDMANGLGGDDVLKGGNGDDRLDGGPGADLLLAGRGDDNLSSGLASTIPTEMDRLYGQIGRDTLIGSSGNDFIDGGAGDDIIVGGGGNDQIFGREGNDQIVNYAGNALLDGGFGNDLLFDQGGTNTILGRSGSDRISFAGHDTVSGGDDPDAIVWRGSDALDAEVSLGGGADSIRPTYEQVVPNSGFYSGGAVEITDFVRGEDVIVQALFRYAPEGGEDEPESGLRADFAQFDTNGDGTLNTLDRGVADDGSGLVITLNVALRNAAAAANYDVSIGQAMTLKLAGVTELTAADFTNV